MLIVVVILKFNTAFDKHQGEEESTLNRNITKSQANDSRKNSSLFPNRGNKSA